MQQTQNKLREELEHFWDTVRGEIQTAIEGINWGYNQNLHGFDMSKMKIPEPKPYSGTRDVREFENFIYNLE